MGKALFRGGRVGTLIIFYEAEPTANNTLQVAVSPLGLMGDSAKIANKV